MITQRSCIVLALLGAVLSGCASLPADSGRGELSTLLKQRGHDVKAAGDVAATRLLLAELADRPLHSTDAVWLALVNNPQIRAEYAQLGFAAAEVYDAGRLSNPRFSVSVLEPSVRHENKQIGLDLVQNFSNLLLLPSRSRFARGEFERVKQTVGANVLNLAADTEAAYYRLVGAWQITTLRRAVHAAAAAAAELAQRFFDAGNINRLDLALQQAAASQSRIDVLAAEAEVTVARSALNRLMGLTATEGKWKILDRMPAPLEEEDSVPQLFLLADANRLDLVAARQRVSVLADALGEVRRFRLLGEFEAGIETEREPDGSRLTGPGLSLELPIFNQGRGRVARAEAGLQEAEAELRTLEIAISNAVQRAADEVAAAKARAAHYRQSLIPLREAIVARTQEQVNYMLESQFQLLQVKQQEYDAYQGYLDAVRDYWLARVELRREVGTALPSGTTTGAATLDADTLIQSHGGSGEQMQQEGMQIPRQPSNEPHHGVHP